MTLEQQRIAIAKACGYFPMPWGWGCATDESRPFAANKFTFDDLPDYLFDLNAMHEAVGVLTDDQKWDFMDYLMAVANGHTDIVQFHKYLDGFPNEHHSWAMITAKPEVWAEAFLRTLGLWRD